ncbi:DUF6980 family protein [Pseudooceanicola sp. C21-150M6]|uniref:DUF6980 family protein n=1 Tax=Pseudooceanicola sp. C21-150M6 TaxID=3434355 RepID=UPI003D7F6266
MAHCCETMARVIDPDCAEHEDPRECEDALVLYQPRFDSYALYARFGSPWSTSIAFCPWCGDRKRDLSDLWFDRIEAMGLDPAEDAARIPDKYKTDAWWKEDGL